MISALSIKKPVITVVMFLVLAITGLISFHQLGIDENPNLDVPLVNIIVTQQGAGPTELETQVTKKIEDAVASLDNIDEITSEITDSRSVTTLSFVLGTNSDRAINDVRNAVDQIRQDLPQDINEPVVKRLEFIGGSIMTYAVVSDRQSVEELSDLVDRQISRALLNVPGVAQVQRLGGVDREIRVNLKPSRLQAYRITATQVNDQIRNWNINLSGGRSEIGGSEQNIRTLGSAKTLRDLQTYPIILPNGDTVPLEKLGKVKDKFGDRRQSAFFSRGSGSLKSYVDAEPNSQGQSVVAFSVFRSSGSTIVTVEEGVREAIEELQTTLPEDLKLELIFTLADDIRGSYKSTIGALIIGCILTVVTVGFFLRDWRVTLITATALPLSIIPTFAIMKGLNYTLNGMTLLALALAIGNLVDDAICMIEIIDQHLQRGKTPLQAAMDGAKEIGLAVVATTATVVAVFVPVAFMGGIPGQFFKPFGLTVSVSTMFSTLVAVTMTPMLSAYLLKPKSLSNSGNSYNDQLNGNEGQEKRRPYRTFLTWALRHRITTLLCALAFFIGSLQLIPFIPQGLFGGLDYGLVNVSIELPPGSTLTETEEVMQQIHLLLEGNSAIKSILTKTDTINSGLAYVTLVPKDERDLSQEELAQQIREDFQTIPGARVSIRSDTAGGTPKDVSLIFKSENPTVLSQTAAELERQMREIPGLVEVSSSLSLVKPELVIEPNAERATDLGVSVQAIAQTASLAFLGDTDSNLAKFNLPDRQIPIRVQFIPQAREDLETLKNLRVPSSNGALVPLSAVADLRIASGPATIQRFNRSRQVTLDANLEGISLGQAINAIRALPAMDLPPEVSEEPAGDAKIMRDIFTRFLGAVGLAILSMYSILVLLYNNFLYPFAILVALPLSIGGALLGLLIAQKELGLFALIGIILLMGLVTKNAILLVDFTLEGKRQGKSLFQATVDAGVSRLRPILMTSISTIAGMMPIALEFGADGELRSPMAIAVIGGFSTSTLLTLIVVPVLFSYIDNFFCWFKQLLGFENKPQRQKNKASC